MTSDQGSAALSFLCQAAEIASSPVWLIDEIDEQLALSRRVLQDVGDELDPVADPTRLVEEALLAAQLLVKVRIGMEIQVDVESLSCRMVSVPKDHYGA